jgi:chromosomal replication initiator protein
MSFVPVPAAVLNQWVRILGALEKKINRQSFETWLKPTRFSHIDGRTLHVRIPSEEFEHVNTKYSDLIFEAIEQLGLELDQVVFDVPPPEAAVRLREDGGFAPQPAHSQNAPRRNYSQGGPEQSRFDWNTAAQLNPRYQFDSFVVGTGNQFAHAASQAVAERPSKAYNPLFLYGGVGLGKTHLMHAIAWHIRRNTPSRKVIYLSAEKFMYQFIRALRFKEALAFKEQFRSVDVLMIDDVQFISGKDSTQEEFFHTFNALVDQNKQLVISGDRSPSDLDIEERVRSRLGWGLVADIHATSYELRLGILQSKIEKMPGVQIPPKVLEFLAHKISSNVRELEGALNRVVAHATFVGKAVTLETTQEVLHDLLRANDRRITIEDIQKQVAGHYNIKVSDMHSARRARAVARPRQVAMYLSKRLTSKSLPEIGRRFGGKDHTTVMHAVKRVEEICKIDNDFAQDVDLLTKMLQN